MEYCRSKVSLIILKIRNLNTVTPRGHSSAFYANLGLSFKRSNEKTLDLRLRCTLDGPISLLEMCVEICVSRTMKTQTSNKIE